MTQITISSEELSDLIGLVYDSAFEEQQWKSLLERISTLFPGVGAIVYGIDADSMLTEYPGSEATPFFDEPVQLENDWSETSAMEKLQCLPNGFVSRTREEMDEERYAASTIYRAHLQPAGYRHAIHIKLDGLGQRCAFIGFGIPADATAEHRIHDPLYDLLTLLSPHAVRALHLSRALSLAKQATHAFSGFLDGIILPMLVTDAHGKYLFANAAGRRVLDRGAMLHLLGNGCLGFDDEEDSRALLDKIALIDRDGTPGGLRIFSDPAPVLLSITPFRASMREASAIDRHLLSEEKMFAIFIGQTEQDAVNTPLLEDVFDLTPREAEVCRDVMLGSSATHIAAASGRSLKTVRNQIQVIYEKVGVSSNIALIDALSVFRTVGAMFEEDSGKDRPARLA